MKAIFVGAILLTGITIGFPLIIHADAATNIGQLNTTSNNCGVNAGPVGCVNAGISTAVITPPVPTQSIDITGTQNIEESNQCDDDAGDTCFNGGFGPVNSFNLTHDTAADVEVQLFGEDIMQKNTCKFFQACSNSGANDFTIVAQDDDGVAATGFDVSVRSSSQIVHQTNSCEGDPASAANPLCNNVDGLNSIKISSLIDGDVKLGHSTQEVSQLNNCDSSIGIDFTLAVICNNQGFNGLGSDRFDSRGLVADGEAARTDLGTNTQTLGQVNECSFAGTACENSGVSNVGLGSQGNSSTTLGDNTQTIDTQTNECTNTGGINGEATTCNNFGINGVFLDSLDSGNIAISGNAQTTSQSNSCDNTGISITQCTNLGDTSLSATVSGNGSLVGSSVQTTTLSNKCSDAFCSNGGGAANFFLVGADGTLSSVNTQSIEKFNNCAQTTCINGGLPGNFIVVDGAASVDSINDQRMTQTNDGCLTPICANSVFLLNDIVASDNSSVISSNTQSIDQSNSDCSSCGNSASSINTASAVGNSSIVLRTEQSTPQTNTCEVRCFNDGSNFIGVSTDDNDRVSASFIQSATGSNNCPSSCQNFMSNSAILEPGSSLVEEGTTSRVTLHQLGEQENECTFGSSCSNSASNSANVETKGNGGDENIDQQIEQKNRCLFGSTCANTGSTSATGENNANGNSDVKQDIDQQNLCIKDSVCSNTGSLADASGSNTQSNRCIDDSTCNNSGQNDKTICTGSANCENSGTDTKVISRGEDCSSGDSGTTTICTAGRIITR